MIEALTTYLGYDFVRSALIAGTLSAILGAIVGYFVIVRKVGFAGATGAAVLGISPLQGMLLLTVGSGIFMGVTGDKAHRSDMAIGMVLSMSLGLGTLFLSLYAGFAGQATAILFGNIFGVSGTQITEMVVLSLISLVGLAAFSRRLLFASTQPQLAEARGLSLAGLSIAFMVVLSIAVTLASQIVGILLVFTLIIAPAGIALRVCRSFWSGMITAIILGVVAVWVGILMACVTDRPVTFWITGLFFLIYVLVEGYCRFFMRSER